jgi:signal transduction histidine kinase
MSNEIRAPLSNIISFSEIAQDDDLVQKTSDYLANIRTNADWMLQIINDILDISKIESGEMSLKKIPFDMHELFASCRTLIMPKAVEKGILLHFYAEPSVGKKPVGDPVRLRQIFVNLLSNAVKFTHAGMVKLVSDIISIDDKSITIHFEIKDSGIGMTPEQVAVIFEPFLQSEAAPQKYGGTGLGLPITKSIIEMMGGKLYIDSTHGVGSRFSFDLTFDTLDASMDDISQNKNINKDIEKPLFEGEVLICEDDFMKQEVIREHLTRVGL